MDGAKLNSTFRLLIELSFRCALSFRCRMLSRDLVASMFASHFTAQIGLRGTDVGIIKISQVIIKSICRLVNRICGLSLERWF